MNYYFLHLIIYLKITSKCIHWLSRENFLALLLRNAIKASSALWGLTQTLSLTKNHHGTDSKLYLHNNNDDDDDDNNELRLQYKRSGKKEKCGEGEKDSSIYLCCHTHKRPSKYVVFNNKWVRKINMIGRVRLVVI